MEDANYHWFFLLRFVARVPARVRLPGGGIIKICQKLEIGNSFCDQRVPGDRTFQQLAQKTETRITMDAVQGPAIY